MTRFVRRMSTAARGVPWLLALAVVLAACGGDDGVHDAAPVDATAADAALPDAFGADAGEPDAHADAAEPDAGPTLPACADPDDPDRDGHPGYPGDPGCTDLEDPDETDDCPTGPGCPRCGNTTDDDGDQASDYPDDVGCASASDDDEADQCVAGLDAQRIDASIIGELEAGPSAATASCRPDTAASPEDVWAFRIEEPLEVLQFVSYWRPPGSLYYPILSVRYADCGSPAAEHWCEPDPRSNGTHLRIGDPVPGTYYLFVDAGDALGGYSVGINATVPSGAPCGVRNDYVGYCIPGEDCGSDGICRPMACTDGIDNDGDGHVDWPDDPGCYAAHAPGEDDGCDTGGACAGCADGVDNDGDGRTDYPQEPDCPFAAFPAEAPSCPGEATPLIPITGPVISGTTIGATSEHRLETAYYCGQDDDDFGAPDVVHSLRLAGEASLILGNRGSFYGMLAGISKIACDYYDQCVESTYETGETIDYAGPGYIYVTIDGDDGASGAYELSLHGTYHAGSGCDQAQIDTGLMECERFTTCRDGLCRY